MITLTSYKIKLTNKTLFGQLNSESPGNLLQLSVLQQTESAELRKNMSPWLHYFLQNKNFPYKATVSTRY